MRRGPPSPSQVNKPKGSTFPPVDVRSSVWQLNNVPKVSTGDLEDRMRTALPRRYPGPLYLGWPQESLATPWVTIGKDVQTNGVWIGRRQWERARRVPFEWPKLGQVHDVNLPLLFLSVPASFPLSSLLLAFGGWMQGPGGRGQGCGVRTLLAGLRPSSSWLAGQGAA